VPDAAHVDSYLVAERLRKSVREELRHGSQILTELTGATEQALLRLAELVDRHMASASHSEAVGRYAEAMGERFGLGPGLVKRLRLAGLLHDVGKIGVHGSILAKPGPLTGEERAQLNLHPEIGARIVHNAGLTDVAQWIGAHHERPDGRGYPRGLAAGEIPLQALILAVADAYDAMINTRAYRATMGPERAREELVRNAGTQFHLEVVECFMALLDGRAFEEPAR
jgi:HD-GYP domain-containing protein (c-di-GMP phosphodiesterase class II)